MNATRWLTKGAASPLGQFGRAAYRFVFPPCCPLCHRETESTTREIADQAVSPVLCHSCIEELLPPNEARLNRCRRCGMTLGPHIRSDAGCPNCQPRSFCFDQVVRLGTYEGLLRDACIRGKAPHMQPVSAALANLLWQVERGALNEVHADLVVPVPRHWTRRVLREHHQAETLSRVLAQRLGLPHARTLLSKVRLTPDQSDLTAAQRKQNLQRAFAVRFGQRGIANKTILLVDDILTTGTTANECARTLRQAGANRVVVAVVAVVLPAWRYSATELTS